MPWQPCGCERREVEARLPQNLEEADPAGVTVETTKVVKGKWVRGGGGTL